MKFHILLMTSMLALAACGGSGDSDIGGGGVGGGGDIPVTDPGGGIDPGDLPVDGTEACGGFLCSGDITNVTFEANGPGTGDDLLVLTDLPFDDDPNGAQFTFLEAITTTDGSVYNVYTNADLLPIPGFNTYLAIYKETDGGELRLGVAAIEGYVPFGYTGAWYDVDELIASIPDEGLVEYQGGYAGTLTFAGNGSLATISGDVSMQVDFTDSRLKGFITNRALENTSLVGPAITNPGDSSFLPTLVLNDAAITGGAFSGSVNSYDEEGAVVENGTYQGFFGGSDGAVIGGLVQATGAFDFNGEDNDDPDLEFTSRDLGVFTADRLPFPDP